MKDGLKIEINALPGLPAVPADRVGVVAMPGAVPGLGRLPSFLMTRIPDDTNHSFVTAAQACQDAGLTLCSDAQWQRVCALDDRLANVETWTMTPASNYQKIQVRGGNRGCESGGEAGPEEAKAERAGLCCSRAAAVDGTRTAFDWMRALPAFDYEDAINRRDRAAVAEALDDELDQFFLQSDVSRDDVVKMAMSYMASQKGMWAVSSQCSLGTVTERTAIDCTRLVVREGKFMWVGSRYIVSEKHSTKLAAILDLKVYRPLSK
jgi:hypothetical protein